MRGVPSYLISVLDNVGHDKQCLKVYIVSPCRTAWHMDKCTACCLTGKGRSKGVLIQSEGHAACKILVVLPLPDRGGVCGAALATMTRPWMLTRRTSPTGPALKCPGLGACTPC